MAQPLQQATDALEPIKANHLQRLTSAHRVLIQDHLDGFSREEIASRHGYSPVGVGLVLNSPLAQQEIARRRSQLESAALGVGLSTAKETKQIIDRAGHKAAVTMEQLLDDPDGNIRFKSAKDLLDRTYGQGASTQPIIQLNAERMNVLVEALQESRAFRPPTHHAVGAPQSQLPSAGENTVGSEDSVSQQEEQAA